MAIVDLDFRGITPAQMGGTQDHIPPGRYNLKVAACEDKPSSNGNPMLTFRFEVVGGDQAGRRLADRFVLSNQEFPRQKLMAFLQALGLPIESKAVRLNTDMCIGKFVAAEVEDNEMPLRDSDPVGTRPRVSSQIRAYLQVKTATATAPEPAPAATAAYEEETPATLEEVAQDVEKLFA